MKNKIWIIFTLGLLAALSPFTIDMYLPAFPQIANDLHTTTGKLALSLSSYFAGIALGQLFYGPLLDRFGRKKPLYAGLFLYILASIGCMLAKNLDHLIFWRFIVGIGGCVASVASMAMVRDFFSFQESSKIFSLMILVMGVSPLLAPTIGSILVFYIEWRAIFLILIFIVFITLLFSYFFLPEKHVPDKSVLLIPGPIIHSYIQVFFTKEFYTYAVSGAIAFASLFVYIAASPIIFFTFFKLDTYTYSWTFTILATGFIISSPVNYFLLRYFQSFQILKGSLFFQGAVSIIFLLCVCSNWLPFKIALALFFILLCSIGLSSINAPVLAMVPFMKNAGSASALFSFLQIFIGSIASMGISLFNAGTLSPIAFIFVILALSSAITLSIGRKISCKNI